VKQKIFHPLVASVKALLNTTPQKHNSFNLSYQEIILNSDGFFIQCYAFENHLFGAHISTLVPLYW
jgi:hypothetical protein